jgi:hypothetical protein
MKTKLFLLALSISVIALNSSCRKIVREAQDTLTASDNEQAEGISDDATAIADNAARLGNQFSMRTDGSQSVYEALSQCATITHDSLSNPKSLIIDFGSTNCLCRDGRYRRGKILVSYTGKYFETGSVRTMTFDNFYRNDNKLEGTRTITNNGLNAQGQFFWTINANNMKVTKTDGKIHTWNSTRTRTMIAGQYTTDWYDDEYLISGSASGINGRGENYTAQITTPLHRALSCRWIDSGVIEISPEDRRTRIVNFGSGTCDNEATITVGNRSRTINMN